MAIQGRRRLRVEPVPGHAIALALRRSTTRAVVREIQASGAETLTGIARTLQGRCVRTPAGRTEWQPVQVSRLLAA